MSSFLPTWGCCVPSGNGPAINKFTQAKNPGVITGLLFLLHLYLITKDILEDLVSRNFKSIPLLPLDCKDIKLVNLKGNQPWMFTGKMDAEAEAPILWLPDAKNRLTEKDPDAGNGWRQEEKGSTEDEMVWWHHWLSGPEFEQAPGVGDGQGGLACCRPWGCKESDTTERLNNNHHYFLPPLPCPCPSYHYFLSELFQNPPNWSPTNPSSAGGIHFLWNKIHILSLTCAKF